MKISIIIPFYNEEENAEWVLKEVQELQPEAEIIAVDDGSIDATPQIIKRLKDVRLISFPKNTGQSAALYTGLVNASSDICVLMDGDGQNNPASIPTLLENLSGANAVFGYRENRNDTWSIKAASRVANRTRNFFLHDDIRDAGCTLKAIRREHIRFLVPFSEMQCFTGALLRNAGVEILEVPVKHRARQFGKSNYTIHRRAWRGIQDLRGMRWILKRQIQWSEGFPHLTKKD